MRDRSGGIGLLVVGAIGALFIAGAGIISFDWPWKIDEIAAIETSVIVEEPPTIFRIEPINLDCRARVHAEVPLRGVREHEILGQVYRTDTVTMTAIGDVDTCVEADGVEVIERSDGGFSIIVPGDSIKFVRPRVDAVRTAESVSFDKGFVGKLTDVFPWVSDDNSLTITNAWLTIKAEIADADPGLFQKAITTSDVPGTGQIEDKGTGDVDMVVRFDLKPDDTLLIGSDILRHFSIKVKTTAGLFYTPEKGQIAGTQRVTITS